MEQSRKEFEAWITDRFPVSVKRMKNGAYLHTNVNGMWAAWQASRAAVVVELPSAHDDAWNDQRMGFNIGIELCRETIEAQGLTVK